MVRKSCTLHPTAHSSQLDGEKIARRKYRFLWLALELRNPSVSNLSVFQVVMIKVPSPSTSVVSIFMATYDREQKRCRIELQTLTISISAATIWRDQFDTNQVAQKVTDTNEATMCGKSLPNFVLSACSEGIVAQIFFSLAGSFIVRC